MAGALSRTDTLPKVVMLGCGNVATHLARALHGAGAEVAQIYNHRIENARRLAAETGATATDTVDGIIDDADLYIISVVDDAILPLVESLGKRQGVWVHTSGTTPASVLAPVTGRHGVLYPLQTFSRDVEVDMTRVPIFTEAADDASLALIDRTAAAISRSVSHADSEKRKLLHISAVFACNFTNHLWSFAVDILREADEELDVLRPLIEVTLAKALAAGPLAGQTGPARRGDLGTIKSHLDALPEGEARELYRLLSESILKKFHHTYDLK